jgi:DNA/RNA-binding domain of Phe-tRNA-synthetase-like protein
MQTISVLLPIQAGVLQVSALKVTCDHRAYAELIACGQRYRNNFSDLPISEIPGIQISRRLFRALGIEPTKHRPSSEALLRRFLKDKPVFRVNTLVDVSNWCALDFLLPNGVYDRDTIRGQIVLRQGQNGETYAGLNNQEIHLAGRYTLVDDDGPFGSPITDSRRTAVTEASSNILALVYAPLDFDQNELLAKCRLFAQRIIQFCGGKIDDVYVQNQEFISKAINQNST